MTSFLSYIAHDLQERYGTNLSHTVVVFPNKRAALFLNEELMGAACENGEKRPMWSPRYVTISELFRKQTKLLVADHIKLVCELYGVYKEITNTDESLDEFYSWGELLLSDFDDIDKNMGDVRMILENTAQQHEYDNIDYLTDTQKELLKTFFANFTDHQDSVIRNNFEKLWNKLLDIYMAFKERLRSKGLAYEGMLYREVVDNVKELNTMGAERFVFAGFNMVQKVEQKLFEQLERQSEVHYYWDYDEYYMPDGKGFTHEAGKYINEYLKHFPNDITNPKLFRNFRKPKNVSFINASTEDIQARYVAQWLTPERIKAGKRTAIVLCNEGLLPTVINCLPPAVEHVNVTMGYPLAITPAATLVQLTFNIFHGKNANLRLRQVNEMLRHPYVQYISPLSGELMERLNREHVFFPKPEDIALDDNLKQMFASLEGKTAEEKNIAITDRLMWMMKTISMATKKTASPIMQESVFRMYTLLSRLRSLVANDGLCVDTITFRRLVMEAIRSTNVPFHGEPVAGIQIMGVLETRNLDFDNVLILSCNEGNMPKGVNDSSFIPHSIRKAYSLTTVENKVGIYAYYFHRLLQRATDIEISYNSSTEDGNMGEKSRFMSQMLAESGLPINIRTFNAPLIPVISESKPAEKDDEVMEKLNSMRNISPTAINTYQRCPMQFFFKYVRGIKDSNEDEDDTDLNNRMFGLVFHRAMKEIYAPFLNKTLTESIIENIKKDAHIIEGAIDKAIKIELFRMPEEEADNRKLPKLGGNEVVQRNVIRRLIMQLLDYDKRCCPIQIKGLEKEVWFDSSFNMSDNTERQIRFKGTIDRLDAVTGPEGHLITRVIDYKTGNSKQPTLESIDDVFDASKIGSHSDYYLQTLLYSLIMSSETDGGVSPCLVYPSHVRSADYSPILTFGQKNKKFSILDVEPFREAFANGIKSLLTQIFSPGIPFTPTEHTDRCKECFYRNICQN